MRADAQDCFLPVTGPPGCGKTVYATQLLTMLQVAQQKGDKSLAGAHIQHLDVEFVCTVARFSNMLFEVIQQFVLMM